MAETDEGKEQILKDMPVFGNAYSDLFLMQLVRALILDATTSIAVRYAAYRKDVQIYDARSDAYERAVVNDYVTIQWHLKLISDEEYHKVRIQ